MSYPVDEQIETVPSPENGNLASQEDLLSSQPPLGPEEGTIEVPCVPVGSQPIILPDSPINDWTMDADESYEPQNGSNGVVCLEFHSLCVVSRPS